MQINNSHIVTTRGFTLVEMIVAVSLFMIVSIVALSSLFAVVRTSQRSIEIQKMTDNVSFALDTMTRTMRIGYSYYCSNDDSFSTPPAGVSDCSSGGTVLAFTDSYGVRTAYRYNESAKRIEVMTEEDTAWIPLTSDTTVRVMSAYFIVGGSPVSDGLQPFVQIMLRTQSPADDTILPINMQTQVTQLIIDS